MRSSSRSIAVLAALGLLVAGAWVLGVGQGTRQALLWGLGAALGAVLYTATFSFAGAFRRLLAIGRGDGLRAQMILLALCVAAFLPAIESGTVLGQAVRGLVFPTGVALLLGAFLFGVGMQLGGGCASGTLYTAGGGSPRMWITLGFIVVGATLAAYTAESWQDWPALPPIAFAERIGVGPAVAASLGLFGLVTFASVRIEKARHGTVETPARWIWGAALLAVLCFATLVLVGRPWAITAAFPLWGSRLVELTGWDDPVFWAFWEDPTRTEALLRPVLADRTTVMDVGLMAGAFLAAALTGGLAATRLPPIGEIGASVVGGLLLGAGAVLASGCNISAYLGGIASGSLHGWVWIFPALAGNWVGILLRPWFGLEVPSAPKRI